LDSRGDAEAEHAASATILMGALLDLSWSKLTIKTRKSCLWCKPIGA